MKTTRRIYEMMVLAARAHAKWDLETSTTILKNRRKLLVLLILATPILLVSVASASVGLPEILGGHKAYSPAFYTPEIFGMSIIIGMCAGLITGCIGAGGGFIITPALMSVGIKGVLAVGTDLFHIFAKAIMGTTIHRKLGNVSVGLALAFLAGSGLGVLGGGFINRALYEINPVLSDTFITLLYVLMLGFLGIYSMRDFLKLRKAGGRGDAHGDPGAYGDDFEEKSLASKLQSIKIPPVITFDHDLAQGGKRIPAVFVSMCGAFVGFVAAIMGVGGGFLTFPMFVYVLGVSSFTTVGTDIFQIIFTAGFAAISQYAIFGFIFYTLAMGMLLGSLVGVQIGAFTTKVVKGIYIRGFYATAILAGFFNRLFALPEKLSEMEIIDLSPAVGQTLETIGNILFFITIGVFSIWVISKFFTNLKTLRGKEE